MKEIIVKFVEDKNIKIMLAVNGIYDGKKVRLIDKIKEKRKYRVVVTFIEELEQSDDDLRNFSAQTNGMEFWKDEKEDLYQDYLSPKVIDK